MAALITLAMITCLVHRCKSEQGQRMKPVIFVSSIVDGFREFREAARQGVEAGGGRALLVNEDFPSLAISPRNACLDAIESSDYLISIAGLRGGWTAPSGQLVVEEELVYAHRRNLRVLGFVQEGRRDADADRFAKRLSDFLRGGFRTTFNTPDELRTQVERAVRQIVDHLSLEQPMDPDLSGHFSSVQSKSGSSAMLRFVLMPEREHELIDPVTMSSDEFRIRLYEIGLQRNVGLLNHEQAKSSELRRDRRIVEQKRLDGRFGEDEYVRLEVSEAGLMVLDLNVTARTRVGQRRDTTDMFVVPVENIEAVLATCFHFAGALYDAPDPFLRHERFHYNVALYGLGYRQLQRNPRPQVSHSMSMRDSKPLTAYDRSRTIARAALAEPRPEVDRVLVLLERKAST